jgi:Protein of unknown function (DUF1353)
MGFPDDTVVQVEQVDDENWKILREIRYESLERTFVAKVGSPTDFASVPRVFIWLLPRYGAYTKAAIIHDYLWREGVVKEEITLRKADTLFRVAMSELNVPFLTRWVMWGAVRWGAIKKHGPMGDWLRDFPVVLLFTAIMLPVILVPAVVILLGLGVFLVIEWLGWLVLKVWSVVSGLVSPGREPRAPLNPPSISWKV